MRNVNKIEEQQPPSFSGTSKTESVTRPRLSVFGDGEAGGAENSRRRGEMGAVFLDAL